MSLDVIDPLHRESFLRLLLDATTEGFYSVDTEGTTTLCNASFLRMLGYASEKDVIGRKLHDEIHHSHPDGAPYDVRDCPIYRTANEGKSACIYNERFFRVDGTSFPVDYRVEPIWHEGVLKGCVCTFSDVSERVRNEEALKNSQARLSLMVESAEDYAIISTDENGRIVSWNYGAERIFEYKADDVAGEAIDMIFTEEDRAGGVPQNEMSISARLGRANDERWHRRRSGERFYASGSMAAMKDDDGHVVGYIKIARDMTQMQMTQEALIEARNAAEAANIAKTDFLANMSHEIRTPMNAVIGLSNILASSDPLTSKQRNYINTLQTSANSLLSLINDLLDIAKIEARTVELEHVPFSLAQILRDVVSMMNVRANEKGLTFSGIEETGGHYMFVGDPTRLRQILVNLCSNAVKFTHHGGIHIGVAYAPGLMPETEIVSISVTDSGIGVAADKLDTIFHKFAQADSSINRRYGGTGLGLAITKTLAEIMGGTITVESEPGVGSTFTLNIPLELAYAEDLKKFNGLMSAKVTVPVPSPDRAHVLLVENYAPNVMVATIFLEQFGYSCDTATSGAEALEKLKTGKYSAVLMDVQMQGMDGLEATRHIRAREETENSPRIPIIGMTAHALTGDRERCLAIGMDDYIAKPFNPEKFRQLLQTYAK